MNLNLEACRKCPTQCVLKDRTAAIVVRAKDEELTSKAIKDARGRLSVLAQQSRNIGCPNSEILSARQDAYDEIDPKLKFGWNQGRGSTRSLLDRPTSPAGLERDLYVASAVIKGQAYKRDR